MNIIKNILNQKNNSIDFISYILLPFLIILMIKYSKINNLKYNQTCKKRWARQIFSYLRNDNGIVEEINNDKVYFFKKNKKKSQKLCGIEEHSSVHINTDFPLVQEYCNDKKKFLYVISPEYTPTTIFIDSFTQTEKELNFNKYILNKKKNKKNYLNNQEIDLSDKEIDIVDEEGDIDDEESEYNLENNSLIDNIFVLDGKENKEINQNYFPVFENNEIIDNEQIYVKEKSIISNKLIVMKGRFIKKPLVGSQGNGIEIIDDFNKCFIKQGKININSNFIFQEEIIPKLIKGYKFDIRYFTVLVVTQTDIKIKHIPHAFVRLCSKKFSTEENDLYANLTNTSINKDVNCTLSICKIDEEWEEYFNKMKIITDDFFEKVINKLGRESFFKVNGNSVASTRIFGFDFIISEKNEVYILEGNYCPGDNTYYGSECKSKVIEYYAEKIIKKLI